MRATRRLAALLLLAALAVAPAGCRDKSEGSARVVVIGSGPPALKDPAAGPLPPPDSVLLSNVAQGLVSFDPAGNIVGGLAERWNVSDDGLSYIFRIASAEWPDGRKITAQQVARLIKRQLAPRSKNPLKDALGAVEDVVAMTDRVIEIRLVAPRPNLLPLLAQPEFAILRDGQGTGPFTIAGKADGNALRLAREVTSADGDVKRRDEVLLGSAAVDAAVRGFADGSSDLVLGGTFADLPAARRVKLPRGALRFDPASGLFGLVPTRSDGILASPEVRAMLSQAIDRAAFVSALNVPGLTGRATVLEPGLDGIAAPVQPAWAGTPIADRLAALRPVAARLLDGKEPATLRILLPDGAAGDQLFNHLAAGWGQLGITLERASSAAAADLKLVDLVAPSSSPAWFLRQFRCGSAAVCDPDIDKLLDAARLAPVPAQRYALLAQAAARVDEAQLFIPLAAPVRWSLVAPRIQGFAGNRYARHTLTDLEQATGSGG